MNSADKQAVEKTEKQSFHRRELKEPAVAFSSDEGKILFGNSLAAGNAEIFFPLFESYNTQSAPAYCGLTSLCVAMNALLIDPRRIWQGVWRWFSEELLDCCDPLEVIQLKGITLPKLHCLAKCQGAESMMTYAPETSLESFREIVRKSCSIENGEKSVVIASYSRKSLNQTGTGHFSPLGAYNQERDMVLILDTARFKLPPHWVPLSRLYDAMLENDPETNKARGYLIIRCSDTLRANCCLACEEEKLECESESVNEQSSINNIKKTCCNDKEIEENEDKCELKKRQAAMKTCTRVIIENLQTQVPGPI